MMFLLIAIQDDPMFSSDFEKSESGMSHLMSAPNLYKRCKLFLPEALVAHQGPILTHIAQKKAFEKAEKSKKVEDEKASIDAINALKATEESIDITGQQEALRRCEAEKKTKSRSNAEGDQSHQKGVVAQGRDENLGSDRSDRMQRQASKHIYEAMERHSPSLLHQRLHHGDAQQPLGLDMHHGMNSSQRKEKHQSSLLHHNVPADESIQAKEAEIESVKRMSSQLQSEIRELSSSLQVKENVIQAKEAEIESVKKISSQFQSEIRELNSSLQVKENVIQAKEAEMENVKRGTYQLQMQIRNLNTVLQDKERIIQSKENEIQRNSAFIADLQQKVNTGEDTGQFTQLQPSKAGSWSIPREQMKSISMRKIGHGAWGEVYSGTFQGERVAIKIAYRDLLHTTTIDMLKREVMIMANIQHPNLVRFVGAVFDDAVERGRDMPIIVSELMDMNLRDAYKKVNLSPSLISIFCDVAYALHYLHQHSQPIIHRDVSAPNVLLKSLRSGGYQAKVSDFGSANLVKQSTTAGAGAIVYCAPEMFPNEDITAPPQPQTTKVDVFSYGILMLEVIVKEMPTPSTRYTMLQQVKGKWTLMYELIVQCTKPLPCDRLAMADILNKLNRIPH